MLDANDIGGQYGTRRLGFRTGGRPAEWRARIVQIAGELGQGEPVALAIVTRVVLVAVEV